MLPASNGGEGIHFSKSASQQTVEAARPQYHLCQAILQSITRLRGSGAGLLGPGADDTEPRLIWGRRVRKWTPPPTQKAARFFYLLHRQRPDPAQNPRRPHMSPSVSGGFSAVLGTPPRPAVPHVTPPRPPVRLSDSPPRPPPDTPGGPQLRRPVSQVALSVPCPTLRWPLRIPARFSGGAGPPLPPLGSMATLSSAPRSAESRAK